ncbi:MAG: PBP1A family penicillin-binding protein [Thermodesulfobacteriota bacterium]
MRRPIKDGETRRPTSRRPSEAEHVRYKPTSPRPSRRATRPQAARPTRNPSPPFIHWGWHKRRPGWGGRLVLGFDLLVGALVFWAAWTLLVAYHHFEQDLPTLSFLKLEYRPPGVSRFYAADGRLLGEFAEEYRVVVPYQDIPRPVVLAFVAAEDANFFQHPGVDLVGVFRAFLRNIEAGRIVQGGSTITQQITRSFLLSRERSYRRKIREALLAWRLEKNLSKQEILFLYLNQIYLGEGAYGVGGAARVYFNKRVGELTLAEAALLAGLTQAPSRYSPLRNPKAARARQKYVLGRMVRARFITATQAEAALREEIHFQQPPDWNRYVSPLFTEHVRREVEALAGREALYRGGLQVFTTLDLDMQAAAHAALLKGLGELTRRQQGYIGPKARLPESQWEEFLWDQARGYGVRPLEEGRYIEALVVGVDAGKGELSLQTGKYKGRITAAEMAWALGGRSPSTVFTSGDVLEVRALAPDPETGAWDFALEPTLEVQGALLCLDPATGEVKAMIGGRDFKESQFNRAVQARRQPGSAFKPFVYTAAMDNGFSPADVIWDEPVEYEDDRGEIWSPQNYDQGYQGPTTLYMGLVQSRNVVAVRLLEQVGIDRVMECARRMGITSRLAPYLSLALGSSEVSLLEMVSAYGTLANEGVQVAPRFIRRIEDQSGRVLYDFPARRVEALSPQTAFVMTDMLRGVVERGTGTRVKALERPVAGKTGTTNDLADAWFVGYTPGYAAGVWVGYDQRKKLGRRESGGRAAAPIFLYFMEEILKDRPVREFEPPPGVVFAEIDPETGWFADEFSLDYVTVCLREDQVDPDYLYQHSGEEDAPTVGVYFQDGRIVIREEEGEEEEPPGPLPDPSAPAVELDEIYYYEDEALE